MLGVLMDPFDRNLRFEVYRHFAGTTQPPSFEVLVQTMNASREEVVAGLERLADLHALVLAPDSSSIWMAHPFSAVPTVYPVRTARGRFWANCAWDAFGIPVVLGLEDARIPTLCAGTGEPVELGLIRGRLRNNEGFVHFAVPARDFWADIGHT
jgi:hypothetical protein